MPSADEFMELKVNGTKSDFVAALNRTGARSWIPIWQTREEYEMEDHTHFYIILYRKYSTAARSRKEQDVMMAEETINNFPVMVV